MDVNVDVLVLVLAPNDDAKKQWPSNPSPPTADTAAMLSFQKLDVHRCSIEFVAIAADIGRSIPRGHATLREQLQRAAFSVPLNIAEGVGRASEADKARHFAIARGSAMECAAVLDVVRALSALDDEPHRKAVDLLTRVTAMLTKLCR